MLVLQNKFRKRWFQNVSRLQRDSRSSLPGRVRTQTGKDLELKRQLPDEPDTGLKQISADFEKRCFEIALKYFNIDG